MFSLDNLGSINKEKIGKKIISDLSFNYLKKYTITSHPNDTNGNHNYKKKIIKEISKSSHNKKIFQNLSKAKFKKYPLKLNYKPSKSLKDLLEEEKLLNKNLKRANHSRKNTNTKIELFSTNSTLSFLNIKDSNKDIGKFVKIQNDKDKSKNKKKFAATFIENKIRQYIKYNSNKKTKKPDKDYMNSYEKYKKNIIKNNKSYDFFVCYKKHFNKKRNSSFGINENNNKNTNSIKDFYNISINKNTNSTNSLLDNISFSFNKSKNKNKTKTKNKLIKKESNSSKYNTTCTINQNNIRKINLCSLPNLLCNNYILNNKDKIKETIKKYKNRNSYQNLLEHKKKNKNFNKIKIIDNKKIKKHFQNFKLFKKPEKDGKIDKNNKSEEKIYSNKYQVNEDSKLKLKNIENGVRLLLDRFYLIYLNSKQKNTMNI